jgi:hypothetical protein
MRGEPQYQFSLLPSVLCLLALTGCHSMGPSTIPQDRVNYSDAIAESWKDPVLRNLVKLRYMDTPIFLDVGEIVSGYTWQTSINAGGQLSTSRAIQGNSLLLGGQGVYIDRPTKMVGVPRCALATTRALKPIDFQTLLG